MPADLSPSDQPAPEPQQLSYAELRLQRAGIKAGLLYFSAADPRSPDQHIKQNYQVMSADKDDNLAILYPSLNGELETYDNGQKNNPDSLFKRIRLKEPETFVDREGETKTRKYKQPAGTKQLPFFMPGMVAKFLASEVIPVLYFVEGEVKAAAAFARGLNVVGMPSNHVVREVKGGVQVLESQVAELIRRCKVETVVLLHDADALTVTWEKDKDLAKRPRTFSAAVVAFREVLQPLLDDEECALKRAFYMHGRRELCQKGAKGLDDMFELLEGQEAAILEDLAKGMEANKYFAGKNVTTPHYDQIRAYFGVGAVKEPEKEFFKLYRDYIGNREFVFRGRIYVPEGEEVKYVAHQDAGRYARVGSDWYKIVYQLNAAEEKLETLEPWKVGEIQRDYKAFPRFLDECPKYDGFTVVPNFNGGYQRVVHGNLNLMTALPHQPKKGDISNTLRFLKHLFGGEATSEKDIDGDPFTVALDWLTIAHNHPKQQLPVIILVSPENKTGKSTFLNWLNWVYANNATVLNNAQFTMKFNAHYATKFIIGLDEAFQDLDKKAEKERLKQMVTGKEMYIERKGVDLKKVPFYGKIVMCSNDADKVMKIEDGENRWFVVRVPQLKEEDPFLDEKLRAEIPAWLYFLHQRKPHHEQKSRLWFQPEVFITEQFRKIVEATKNRLDLSIEQLIKDMFLTYRLDQFRLVVKWLVKQLNDVSKYRVDENDVRRYLKEKRGMEPAPAPMRVKIPIALSENHKDKLGFPEVEYDNSQSGRPYLFKVEEWLSPAELEAFRHLPEKTDEDNDLPF